MRRAALALVVVCGVGSACQRRQGAPPSAPAADSSVAPQRLALPDTLAGFAGGPLQHGPTWVRRTYAHGTTLIDATLAISPQPPGGFDGWVATSRAGYPQAALSAPPGDVNGFYQCQDGPQPSCDLLIQMRSGVHLELRGGGTSTRDDVDALAGALPLAAWGAGRIDDPH